MAAAAAAAAPAQQFVDHKHSVGPPPPPPPAPPPLVLITENSLPRAVSEYITSPQIEISHPVHLALESWFERKGNDYQSYSLFDDDVSLSCSVWKQVVFMFLKLNKSLFVSPSLSLPTHDDIRRTLMPSTFGPRFETFKTLDDVRRTEVMVLRSLSRKVIHIETAAQQKQTWDRDLLKYATNAFWWIRYYFRLVQLYPFEKFDGYLDAKEPAKKETELHDYIWKGAFQSPTSSHFETSCRDLIFRNQCPMGAESRYCLSHMINAKHFSVIDVAQHELSSEAMMYVEQQTRIPPREKKEELVTSGNSAGALASAAKDVKTPNPADNSVVIPPMDTITRDCWMRQTFCAFWTNPTIPKFDKEYMISWDDWKEPVKCMTKLSDTHVAGKKRPPLVVQFGEQFYVHHWRVKGLTGVREPRFLYATTFKRSLTSALTLWLNIMIYEFDRKVGVHTKMPAVTFWGEPPDKPKYHIGGAM